MKMRPKYEYWLSKSYVMMNESFNIANLLFPIPVFSNNACKVNFDHFHGRSVDR